MALETPTSSGYVYQAPAVLNQAAPVQSTFYDILPATSNVRVYSIAVNIEDTNETLQVQAIVDGETITGTPAVCTHSTTYYAYRTLNAINRTDHLNLGTSYTVGILGFIVEGASVQIQVQKTTAGGVGNLTGIVTYGRLG